jgi:hypothetical protein
MGCFQSRFDRRNIQTSDFVAVTTAFLGGKADELFDNFPVDRVLASLDTSAEPADLIKVEDDLKLGNEEQVTTFYKETLKFLNDHNQVLKKQYGEVADGKEIYVNDKYLAKDVVAQFANVVQFFTENSKIAADVPAATAPAEGAPAEAAPAEAAPAEAAPAEGDAMMEGGDEMAAPEEMMAQMMEGMEGMAGSMDKPNPFTYDKDSRNYEGWNNVAASLLRNMLVNPVFGDMVKANALSWEYNHEKGTKNYTELTKAAALVSAAASKAVTGENNVFISGFVDNDAYEALGDLVKDKQPIHFPFVTAGWGSKEEALNAFAFTPINPKKAGDYKKVLFEVTGAPSFSFAGCRQIVHRLNGSIIAGTDADDVHVFQVAAKKLEAQTVAEWKKAREAKPEPVAAAATAPAGDAPAGDAPAGDAPAGDAPAGDAPAGDAPAGDAPAEGM